MEGICIENEIKNHLIKIYSIESENESKIKDDILLHSARCLIKCLNTKLDIRSRLIVAKKASADASSIVVNSTENIRTIIEDYEFYRIYNLHLSSSAA